MGGDHGEVLRRMRSESFAGGGAEASSEYNTNPPSSHAYSTTTDGYYPPHYHARRDDLRPNVMEAIQEMMSELEDLHKNINEQALQHIHNGEIILTYAFSRTVELVSSGRSGASGRSRSNMFFVVLHRAHTLSHLLDRRAPDESPPPPLSQLADRSSSLKKNRKVVPQGGGGQEAQVPSHRVRGFASLRGARPCEIPRGGWDRHHGHTRRRDLRHHGEGEQGPVAGARRSREYSPAGAGGCSRSFLR